MDGGLIAIARPKHTFKILSTIKNPMNSNNTGFRIDRKRIRQTPEIPQSRSNILTLGPALRRNRKRVAIGNDPTHEFLSAFLIAVVRDVRIKPNKLPFRAPRENHRITLPYVPVSLRRPGYAARTRSITSSAGMLVFGAAANSS